MSRVGNAPITILQGTTVQVDGNIVTVKGKLGELTQEVKNVEVKVEGSEVTVSRKSEAKQDKAFHGLYRSLIHNMVVGVSEGFKNELELIGVGYRASNQGQRLELALGFSHGIVFELPNEVKVETEMVKGQPPRVILSSHDKQLLGMVTAKIRSFRKPEPYKGKGIRFVGEQIRRKAGKSA